MRPFAAYLVFLSFCVITGRCTQVHMQLCVTNNDGAITLQINVKFDCFKRSSAFDFESICFSTVFEYCIREFALMCCVRELEDCVLKNTLNIGFWNTFFVCECLKNLNTVILKANMGIVFVN